MTRYPYLLFDADNTLFDFDEANVSSFRAVCAYAGLAFTPELFACFDRRNNAAWARFDRGELTKDETLRIQFREMSEELGLELDIEGCNRVRLEVLGRSTALVPHALEVVRELKKTHRVYLITNAVESVQRGRLGRSALAPLIEEARRRLSPRPRVRRSRPWNTLTMCSPTSTASRGRIAWSSAIRSRATFRAQTTTGLRAAGSIRRKRRSRRVCAWTTRSAICGSFTTL